MPSSTVRSIASALGLSRTTVSTALRNAPGVTRATALRVQRAAEEMGYHRNPLAGTIMSELRRSRMSTFQGILAAIEIEEPAREDDDFYRLALLRGLKRRAGERGFVVEVFRVRPGPRALGRLDAKLRARGIRGLAILPVRSSPDLSALDWTNYAGVYLDYLIERPPLASIHPDRYRSMMALLDRLAQRGYRRPGLILARDDGQRVQHQWEGPLLAQRMRDGRAAAVPVLKLGALGQEAFAHWFRNHRPDVVLGMDPEVIPWIGELGGAVPERQGFVCLNLLRDPGLCAGLDLQPEVVGAGAADLLTPLLCRHELGLPKVAATTAVPARWMEGPTIRVKAP